MQYVKNWYSVRQAIIYFVCNIKKYFRAIRDGNRDADINSNNSPLPLPDSAGKLAKTSLTTLEFSSENRDVCKVHDNWHDSLPTPRYDWEQILSWQVIRWILNRGIDRLVGSKGVTEDIDLAMDRLLAKNRWEVQDAEHVGRLVGNTPLIAIHLRYLGRRRVIYAKCEHYNLTGRLPVSKLHYLRRSCQ